MSSVDRGYRNLWKEMTSHSQRRILIVIMKAEKSSKDFRIKLI